MENQLTPEQRTGESVRVGRLLLGLTQEALAEKMRSHGFPWRQTTVAKTEAAERPIRINEVVALAAIFKAPVAELMIDDPEGERLSVEAIQAQIKLGETLRAVQRCEVAVQSAATDLLKAKMAYAEAGDAWDQARGSFPIREYDDGQH